MDKLYKVTASACGYYSGAEFEDVMLLTPEIYIKLKDFFENEFYMVVHELDGKHSEVECDIEIEEIDFNSASYVKSKKIFDELIYNDKVLDKDEYEAMNNWLKENLPSYTKYEFELSDDEHKRVIEFIDVLRNKP